MKSANIDRGLLVDRSQPRHSFIPNFLSQGGARFVVLISGVSCRVLLLCVCLFSCLLGTAYGQSATGEQADHAAERTKIAEGQYAIRERGSGGAVGPFEEAVYNFHEYWTLWRDANGEYRVEGMRKFDSPEYEPHSNRFLVQLTRDLTVIRMKEFAKLRWVPDSGPLSCEFLHAQLDCASGGTDPRREIKLQTPLHNPYGLLWPISPFSFVGLARQAERDPTRATGVDLVRIEQPDRENPVRVTILEGPLRYLGEEDIEAAGRKWHAHKFSLKVPLHPEYLIWTSPKGLLVALAIEHEHKDWPKEGLRLVQFEGSSDF